MSFTFTPIFSDNFHRANEQPLKPTTTWVNAESNSLAVVNNLCVGNSNSITGEEVYKATRLPNDQYCAITINNFDLGSTVYPRIRSTVSDVQFYAAVLNANGDGSAQLELNVRVSPGGVPVPLASDITIPVVNQGDVLLIGALGTFIFVYYNGVQVLSATDSTLTGNETGSSGGWHAGPSIIATAIQLDTSISLVVIGGVSNPPVVPPLVPPGGFHVKQQGAYKKNSMALPSPTFSGQISGLRPTGKKSIF